MLKRINGVLLDLNEAEREVFNHLLALAEKHLDEFGRLPKDTFGYYSKDSSRSMAQAVIDGLREELDLPAVVDTQKTRNVEEWRVELALKADYHHVNAQRVVCVYDHCNTTVSRANGANAQHPWLQARQEGWTPYDWKHHGQGGFSEAIGRPSADLVCPAEHDKHGCSLYNGAQDCVYWPNIDR